MWIPFEIEEKKYFLLVKSEGEETSCVIYDGENSWQEIQPMSAIFRRAKEHNKRIQFDEATVRDTLENGEPILTTFETNEDGNRCLKLKYRVKNCPFHFSWYLTDQTEHEFQRFILFKVFRIVQGLTQQNDELRETIKKKDIELQQYKTEGAVLKRVTVSTQKFNFDTFNKKYADVTELTQSLGQISDLLKAQYSALRAPRNTIETESNANSNNANNVKLTPRRKRRKLMEERKRVIAEQIKTRAKALEYESSQSQVLSPSPQEAINSAETTLAAPTLSTSNETPNTSVKTKYVPAKSTRSTAVSGDQNITKITQKAVPKIEFIDSASEQDAISKITASSSSKRSPSDNKTASPSVTPVKRTRSTAPAKVVNVVYDDSSSSSEAENISTKRLQLSPSKGTPSKATPDKSTPSKTTPDKSTPSKTTPDKSTPSKSTTTKSNIAATVETDPLPAERTRPSGKSALQKIIYGSSESLSEGEQQFPTSSALKTESRNDSEAHLKSDVEKLIDEWKALEQLRVADLKKI